MTCAASAMEPVPSPKTGSLGVAEESILVFAGVLLAEHCKKYSVPESHGVEHASKVLQHVEAALEAGGSDTSQSALMPLAVKLAALLHDCDDRKYFKSPAGSFPHAKGLLKKIFGWAKMVAPVIEWWEPEVTGWALEAIALVSASSNGNSVPDGMAPDSLLLYPRYADRLEAIGEIGIRRCWLYTLEVGRPVYRPSTPAPRTREEAAALAPPQRLAAYVAGRVEDDSMLGHYYDKLLHLAAPLQALEGPRVRYFAQQAQERHEQLLEVCTAPRPHGLRARLAAAGCDVAAGRFE